MRGDSDCAEHDASDPPADTFVAPRASAGVAHTCSNSNARAMLRASPPGSGRPPMNRPVASSRRAARAPGLHCCWPPRSRPPGPPTSRSSASSSAQRVRPGKTAATPTPSSALRSCPGNRSR
ncbi:MAG: hypothetical protein MZW92_24180 [Comamonadaceae bacterium]|nr:hypothetical protein [Comamonadaceae bacterium]